MSDEVHTELLHKLETAVANLPWLQREVFLAHRLNNLSCKEIAFLTGLSERHIQRQMAKALGKLCKQLEGEKLSWWERLF